MTPSRLEELRKIAEQATPGPWRSMRNGNSYDGKGHCGSSRIEEVPRTFHEESLQGKSSPHLLTLRDADADFIAAANPAVVLELLDTIKTLREALERINREAYASPSYAESIKKIRVIARDAIGETK
jgi:hypothetical protein